MFEFYRLCIVGDARRRYNGVGGEWNHYDRLRTRASHRYRYLALRSGVFPQPIFVYLLFRPYI